MRQIKYIVIHTTDSWPHWGAAELRAHFRSLGWKSPGYHYAVKTDGSVIRLAADSVVCNGVKGHNAHSIHVAWIGGIITDLNGKPSFGHLTMTSSQWASLRKLCRELLVKYPDAKIVGHRDLSPDLDGDGKISASEWIKTCPLFDVRSEIYPYL